MAGLERIAWVGGAEDGRVVLRDAGGREIVCHDLGEVAEVLHRHPDPWGGFTNAAAALGTALHLLRAGATAWQPRLAEAGVLLSGLPVAPALGRLRACADRHADLLQPREMGARMLLEARRILRTWGEAVERAAELAAGAVPRAGTLLLAWPGSPACDLGPGLLTGALVRGQRAGRADPVLVAGPEALAGDAVAVLAAAGIPARAVDAAEAQAVVAGRPLAGVLLRCVGDGVVTERTAADLASAAARRGLPIIAVGVRDKVRASGEQLAASARRCIADLDGAGWEDGR